jgi:hypothetical protein
MFTSGTTYFNLRNHSHNIGCFAVFHFVYKVGKDYFLNDILNNSCL